jgi:hypothetical protein
VCWASRWSPGSGSGSDCSTAPTIRAVNEVAELRETSRPDRGVMVRIEVLNQRDETVQEREFVTLLKRRGDGP